jgi:hypothetical protein
MVTRAMLAEAFVCYLIIAIAFSQLYLLVEPGGRSPVQ